MVVVEWYVTPYIRTFDHIIFNQHQIGGLCSQPRQGEGTTMTKLYQLPTPNKPPAFLNSGKHSFHLESPFGHGVRTTIKFLLVFASITKHANNLSTSTHRREVGISSAAVRIDSVYVKVMEDRAGAD
jgi:hypothetical protein